MARRSRPKTEHWPLSWLRMPAMTEISVVLPQPEGPTSIISSPARTSRSTPRRATTCDEPLPYVLTTSSHRTAMPVALASAARSALALGSYCNTAVVIVVTVRFSPLEHDGRLELQHLPHAEDGRERA